MKMRARMLAIAALAGAVLTGTAAVAQDRTAQLALGKQKFEYWCATCHGPGIGYMGMPYLPGETALRAKYKGSVPPLLPDRTDLSPDLVKVVVRNGISIMPFFRKTEISDRDLEAIAAYLSRNNPAPK